MWHTKRFFIAGVALVTLFAACSSEKESPVTPTQPPKPPQFKLKAFDFPDKLVQSTDAMAKQVTAMADQVTNFEGTGCIFDPPQNAQAVKEETGNWEYQWTAEGLTQTLKITAGGGRYTWQLFFTGSKEGIGFDNWRKMDVVQRTDLTNGHVYLYKEGSTQIEVEWVWYTLDNGDYKFVKQTYGEPNSKIEITIKTDRSGRIERFAPNSKGNLVYDLRITWNADGSGAWWTFNDGVQTGYGTWN